MLDQRALVRFARYMSVGGSTFLLDLGLLYVFINVIGWQSLLAVGTAFLLSVSVNFAISRVYVFRGSEQLMKTTFTNYLLIAGTGFLFVMGAMYLFVEMWQWSYIFSRVCVAGLAGIANYLLNLYFNFRVVGKDFFDEKADKLVE